MNYTNKRKAPNNMYWVNAVVTGSNKCMMAEQLNEIEFRLWTNSKLAEYDETFTRSSKKTGWYYKDVLHDEITFFDWN